MASLTCAEIDAYVVIDHNCKETRFVVVVCCKENIKMKFRKAFSLLESVCIQHVHLENSSSLYGVMALLVYSECNHVYCCCRL
jgi:hypothetical protein